MIELTLEQAIELQAHLTTLDSALLAFRRGLAEGNTPLVESVAQVMTPSDVLRELAIELTRCLEEKRQQQEEKTNG